MCALAVVAAAVQSCAPFSQHARAQAQRAIYRIVEIPSGNARFATALAINRNGVVAGRIDAAAFTYDGSKRTLYPPVTTSFYGTEYFSEVRAIDSFGTGAGVDGSETPIVMSGLVLTTAVTFSHGSLQFLDRASQATFEADAIDDKGTIAGERAFRGFVRFADGTSIDVQPLSARSGNNGSRVAALDNAGHLAGGSTIPIDSVPQVITGYSGTERIPIYGPDLNAYVVHAVLGTIARNSVRLTDLGALFGYPDTYATALNARHTVVGYSGTTSRPRQTRIGGPSHAWKWQRGHMTDLGSSEGSSYAYGIDDSGTIVGCANGRAVRWIGERREDLNTLVGTNDGWNLTCAHAINRGGTIVGDGEKDGRPAIFELIPVAAPRRALRYPPDR